MVEVTGLATGFQPKLVLGLLNFFIWWCFLLKDIHWLHGILTLFFNMDIIVMLC